MNLRDVVLIFFVVFYSYWLPAEIWRYQVDLPSPSGEEVFKICLQIDTEKQTDAPKEILGGKGKCPSREKDYENSDALYVEIAWIEGQQQQGLNDINDPIGRKTAFLPDGSRVMYTFNPRGIHRWIKKRPDGTHEFARGCMVTYVPVGTVNAGISDSKIAFCKSKGTRPMLVKDDNNEEVEVDAAVCPQIAECFSDEYRLPFVRVKDEVAGTTEHAPKNPTNQSAHSK